MNVLETILSARKGKLVIELAEKLGAPTPVVQNALQGLVPWIAEKIRAKAESDSQDYEDLLEVVDDEEQVNYLEKPDWSFASEAMEDGEAILVHLFGGADEAVALARQDNNLDNDLGRLDGATQKSLLQLTATYVVAAMAARNQALFLTSGEAQEDKSGVLSIIIAALIKGLMQGILRRLRPRRRYRRSGYGRRRRRRSTRRRSYRRRSSSRRRRRRRKPSISDLIGDLFRG